MTLPKVLAELRKRLADSAASVRSLSDEVAALRKRITETRAKLEFVRNAPLPLEEIRDRVIPSSVRELGAWWLAEWHSALIRGDRSLASPRLEGSRNLPWTPKSPIPWAAVCAGKPELAEEVLLNLISAVPFEAGPRSEERPAMIERLEAELAELEAAEEQLIDDAAAAGVQMAHRPEVVQRRQDEAHRKKQDAAAVEARASREKALNERDVAARATRSPYLDRERADSPSQV